MPVQIELGLGSLILDKGTATVRQPVSPSAVAGKPNDVWQKQRRAAFAPLTDADVHPLCVIAFALALIGDPLCSEVVTNLEDLYRARF